MSLQPKQLLAVSGAPGVGEVSAGGPVPVGMALRPLPALPNRFPFAGHSAPVPSSG